MRIVLTLLAILASANATATTSVTITNSDDTILEIVGCDSDRNTASAAIRTELTLLSCTDLKTIAMQTATGDIPCNSRLMRSKTIDDPYRCATDGGVEYLTCSRKKRVLTRPERPTRTNRQRMTVTNIKNDGNCGLDILSIYIEYIVGRYRVIASNGIPDHDYTDNLPGDTCETYQILMVPLDPDSSDTYVASESWVSGTGAIGISRTGGVLYGHTSAEETCRSAYYSEYATFGTCEDDVTGHQAQGQFHYHGPSTCLTRSANVVDESECPIVGYLYDGFPIRSGSGCVSTSCYNLKADEIFSCTVYNCNNRAVNVVKGCDIDDYKYTSSTTCDLDECNGKTEDGHYSYYMTNTYPYTNPLMHGNPDNAFFCFVDTSVY